MSTAELKARIISEITESINGDLLLEVYRLLEIENRDALTYALTEDQLCVVHEAQAQVKAGKFLTEDEANKEIDEWLV